MIEVGSDFDFYLKMVEVPAAGHPPSLLNNLYSCHDDMMYRMYVTVSCLREVRSYWSWRD